MGGLGGRGCAPPEHHLHEHHLPFLENTSKQQYACFGDFLSIVAGPQNLWFCPQQLTFEIAAWMSNCSSENHKPIQANHNGSRQISKRTTKQFEFAPAKGFVNPSYVQPSDSCFQPDDACFQPMYLWNTTICLFISLRLEDLFILDVFKQRNCEHRSSTRNL